jgi:predicted ATP-binding protein involved in virulence
VRLRRIYPSNYRALDDRFYDFDERMTVLAGENGRGKTSLLVLIAKLLEHFVAQVSVAPKPTATLASTDRRSPEVPMGARLELEVPNVGIVYYRCGVANEFPASSYAFETISRPVAESIQNAYGDDPNSSEDAMPLAVLYSTDRSAFRWPNRRLKTPKRGRERAFFQALKPRPLSFSEIALQLQADFASAESGRERNPSFLGDEALAAINEVLGAFLPGFSELRVQEKPYRLIIDKNGDTFQLSQLSDGERGLLALVLDLSRRLILASPRLSNPVAEGSAVVLIDELDLHLHPNWQQTIVEKLLNVFRGCQFICTTHSPFIVQSLDAIQLVNLDGPILNQFSDQGLEEAARFGLKVDVVETSARYREIFDIATRYFDLVGAEEEKWETLTDEERAVAETLAAMLELRTAQVSGDPVYSAFLQQKLARRSPNEAG